MQKVFTIVIALSLILVTLSFAEIFHIRNNSELQNAFEKALKNKQNDILKISRNAVLDPIDYKAEIGFSITIKGGYDEDFQSRLQKKIKVSKTLKTDKNTVPGPQQSKTGPVKPDHIKTPDLKIQFGEMASGGTEKTIGAPPYLWRHGCGPTAVGMIVGYYDTVGYSKLFTGNASTQTDEVDQGIASQRDGTNPAHYEDYSLPEDSSESSPLPDKSEDPQGDEHTNDCIGDFMETSWSKSGNLYGWSYSNKIGPSFTEYVNLVAPEYSPAYNSYSMGSTLTWNILTNEIDNNRPMVFLVDTDGNGDTDHFVTIVGYRDTDGINQYGCLDTWDSTVRWCNFSEMESGVSWGIWGGWSFSLKDFKKTMPWLQLLLLNSQPTDCGAYIAPGVWKEFDCYNLAAIGKTTNDDPFTPSWRLIGGYWQWGRKGPDSSQWYDTNTSNFAHGPIGSGSGEANNGAINGWDTTYAPEGSWSDDSKTANDPCPDGFRVPAKTQWDGVIANNNQSIVGSWSDSATNYTSARFFGNDLMLPAAGGRITLSGSLDFRGNHGYYWSSNQRDNTAALYLGFSSSDAYTSHDYRWFSFSVRCVAK